MNYFSQAKLKVSPSQTTTHLCTVSQDREGGSEVGASLSSLKSIFSVNSVVSKSDALQKILLLHSKASVGKLLKSVTK